MSTRLLSLRNVSEEEAEAVRELLQANRIEFYETPAGNWGISAGAIWLPDAASVERAKALLEAHDRESARVAREHFEELRRTGRQETIWERIRTHPIRTLLYLAAVVLILYLSTVPFLEFLG